MNSMLSQITSLWEILNFADDCVRCYVYVSGPECGIIEFEEAENIGGAV
jgi:hypothetical protein